MHETLCIQVHALLWGSSLSTVAGSKCTLDFSFTSPGEHSELVCQKKYSLIILFLPKTLAIWCYNVRAKSFFCTSFVLPSFCFCPRSCLLLFSCDCTRIFRFDGIIMYIKHRHLWWEYTNKHIWITSHSRINNYCKKLKCVLSSLFCCCFDNSFCILSIFINVLIIFQESIHLHTSVFVSFVTASCSNISSIALILRDSWVDVVKSWPELLFFAFGKLTFYFLSYHPENIN